MRHSIVQYVQTISDQHFLRHLIARYERIECTFLNNLDNKMYTKTFSIQDSLLKMKLQSYFFSLYSRLSATCILLNKPLIDYIPGKDLI